MTAQWVVYGKRDRCRWVRADQAPPVRPSAPRAHHGEDRPFSIGELEQAMRAESPREAAERLDLSIDNLKRLRVAGLTIWQADYFAIRAGFYPTDVWPDW